MANGITTFYDRDGAVATRTLEQIGTPPVGTSVFDGGCNVPGSNSPGIGIATAGNLATQNLTESLPSWTLLDQDEDPRTPQVGQYIGGSGLGDGTAGKGTLGMLVASMNNGASAKGKGFILTTVIEATLADLATGWEGVAPAP